MSDMQIAVWLGREARDDAPLVFALCDITGHYFSDEVEGRFGGGAFLNDNPIPAILVLLLLAGGVSAGLALILERVAYRPLRGAPRLVPLITAIGASLLVSITSWLASGVVANSGRVEVITMKK